ncbi:hypothetical protein BB560_000225 [Smittium megazygosporum]|uniref:Uncharacterized protein n=1 Tax=Smittium megazygosporum TaxID=133381 RepID=A0A2T9ZKZ1_9FUNG|nr:hypothetical protein BB560_000225 [Smittium megazygosporum]
MSYASSSRKNHPSTSAKEFGSALNKNNHTVVNMDRSGFLESQNDVRLNDLSKKVSLLRNYEVLIGIVLLLFLGY